MCFMIVKIFNVMLRTTTRAPQLIVAGIDRNLSQPGSERCLVRAVIGVERKVGLGKAVLDDLFYLLALRKKAAGDAGHLTAVTFEQLLKRLFLASTGSSDQRVICPFCE